MNPPPHTETQKYRKVFVEVILKVSAEGEVRPMFITSENGKTYEVDRLRQRCRAASTKVGGTGIRYTVVICNKETYLFEDDGKWFVEAKVPIITEE